LCGVAIVLIQMSDFTDIERLLELARARLGGGAKQRSVGHGARD